MLLHILLHASGTLLGRTARLLHLHDIARLTATMGPADWDELFRQAQGSSDPQLWWAYPPLLLSDRYFGCVPRAVLERLARACHWQLRRAYRRRTFSDVSLSYLWVSAFPGIEWSRSLGEAAAYAAVRVRPARETLALRRAFAESQPFVSGGAWAHTSQARRIVRWLLARQPRQESLHSVRVSLARPLSSAPRCARGASRAGWLVAHSAELHGQHGNRATVDAFHRIAARLLRVRWRPSRTAAAGSVRAWGWKDAHPRPGRRSR